MHLSFFHHQPPRCGEGGDGGFARTSPTMCLFIKKVPTLEKTMSYRNQWVMTGEMAGD
jgi:hypothetical protein